MESERVSLSRSGDRPVTRWRREPEPIDRPPQTFTERPTTAKARPHSKLERPTSRRGIKTDITEYGISRPPTTGRSNSMSRPPSANVMSRVSTASSRLNTANLSPMNSGLPRNFSQSNIMILDRPVTQQGLAGIRPSSSRGTPKPDRRFQDKRHLKQNLLLKIKDLSQELSSIRRTSTNSENLTTELKELDKQLIDYNTALEKLAVSESNRKEIEHEARRAKSSTERRKSEIERVLQKRALAEKKLEQLEKDDSDFDDDDENHDERVGLIKEIEKLQNEYESLQRNGSAEKSKMEERMANSPTRQEAHKIYARILDAEERRDILLEEQQALDLEKKLSEARLELEVLEASSPPEDGQRRSEELSKLNRLEEQIVERLEKISNDLDGNIDAGVLVAEELEMLRTLMNQNIENRDAKTFDELKRDEIRLRNIATKLEVIEIKLKGGGDKRQPADVWNPEEEDKTGNFMVVNRDYGKLGEKIRSNEAYRFLSILEDKLAKDGEQNDEEFVDDAKLMDKLFGVVQQYNAFLINEMKLTY